ncbi:MAG TPA: thiosulfate oxidation carrier protein SoxY [Candidatus Methylomirabilis sp.]
MIGRPASRSAGVSRRKFLGLASATVGLLSGGGIRRVWGGSQGRRLRSDDPDVLSPFERLHFPVLRLPVVTTNGAKVPVVVEMSHPMESVHYISNLHVVNERDPVPSKGMFHLTPANGQVYLAFQARIDHGVSEVSVTAECNVHGRWSSTQSVNIPDGAGGCAAPAPPPRQTTRDEILPPRIRIPQLVKGGRIRPDEIIDVQLMMRHPNRTGLALRNGRFVQESEPFYLQEMAVFYGAERVSRFAMTSALGDDPFITFRLRARRKEPLRVVLTNSRGQRFEATHPMHPS